MRYKNISKIQLLKHETAIVTVVVVVKPTGTRWSCSQQTLIKLLQKSSHRGRWRDATIVCGGRDLAQQLIFFPTVLFHSQQDAGLAPPTTGSLFETVRRQQLTCARCCCCCSTDPESWYGAPTRQTIADRPRQAAPWRPIVQNHDQGRTVVLTCKEGW